MIINIAKQFSETPGGRYINDGRFSGEEFRKKFLEPSLQNSKEIITVELDGTFGYPVSFLEEAFGGLVNLQGFTKDQLIARFKFESQEDPDLGARIADHIRNR